MPIHAEDYVHRIGRTGRAGHRGRAITLATPDDARYLGAIEKLIGRSIPLINVEGIEPPREDGKAEKPRRASGRSRKRKPAEAERKSPSRGARRERPTAKTRETNGKATKPERSKSDKAKQPKGKSRESSAKPVVGLGDHTPAFLLRPDQSGRK